MLIENPKREIDTSQVDGMKLKEDEFPCYCDANCLNMGDCCQDYKDFCEGET